MLSLNLKKSFCFLLVLRICLPLTAALGADSPGGQDCLRITEDNKTLRNLFSTLLNEERPGTLDLEDGVIARILPWPSPYKQEGWLKVQDGRKKVASFRAYYFTRYFRIEAGLASYWIIEDWNGAAHGGTRHHYFCRAAAGKPLRFLGTILVGDHRTEDTFGPGQIGCRNSQSFVCYDDNRFAYFGTSFAESTAMFFRKFYRLSPRGLVLANRAFPEEYRREIVKIEAEIKTAVAQRQFKPEEITLGDNLGVWLVARTIHYLVLREDKRAWQSLERDVARYYRSKQGLGALKMDIRKKMAESPY